MVLDHNLSSHTTGFHTLGRILVAVAEVEVVSDIVKAVEVAFARRPGYLAADCRSRVDLGVVVDFLC